MNTLNCPCVRECADRLPACHDRCPRYAAWKAERERIKEEINKQHELAYCTNCASRRQYLVAQNHMREKVKLF